MLGGHDWQAACRALVAVLPHQSDPVVIVTKLAGEFEKSFIRFHAAVAEKAFARADEAYKRLGEATLAFMVIEI